MYLRVSLVLLQMLVECFNLTALETILRFSCDVGSIGEAVLAPRPEGMIESAVCTNPRGTATLLRAKLKAVKPSQGWQEMRQELPGE